MTDRIDPGVLDRALGAVLGSACGDADAHLVPGAVAEHAVGSWGKLWPLACRPAHKRESEVLAAEGHARRAVREGEDRPKQGRPSRLAQPQSRPLGGILAVLRVQRLHRPLPLLQRCRGLLLLPPDLPERLVAAGVSGPAALSARRAWRGQCPRLRVLVLGGLAALACCQVRRWRWRNCTAR